MKRRKAICLALLLCVSIMTLFGCGKKKSGDDSEVVRVGSLKGPTSMGLVKLMHDADNNKADGNYEFRIETGADTLLGLMMKEELDIALVPANVASVLYNKSEGAIEVIDINTLGVLYVVSGDMSITDIKDLKGKTIYLTGKGQTPDYVLQYILESNGVTDVKLEYKSEATEVASVLASDSSAIGFLPQPFVTAALAKNDALNIIFDATSEWDKIQGEGGSRLVTGVTIVRKSYAKEHEKEVKKFLKEQKASSAYIETDIDAVASYVEEYGIVEKAAVAKKAMPYCNITYIDGEEMKTALAGYLEVLYNIDPVSVGGSLPADDFYYIP